VSNEFSNGNGWRQPDIPWKGSKEFDVDPNEFNNFEIIVSGRATVSNSLSLIYFSITQATLMLICQFILK
jgi:hypothetical protein